MSALVRISDDLSSELARLRFGAPVTHVYDPLQYAREPHFRYLRRYGGGPKTALLLGMNPGPFGMAQTGVPFGEVELVRDWLGIDGRVDHPRREHPSRPISGFACARSEVSGRRLWSWARDRFDTPERFFAHFFVANYCPLVFMEESGRNRTPDKLASHERERLFARCDHALRRVVEKLKPRHVVGVGRFAEGRARVALAGFDVAIGHIPHPSPASPAANRGWAALAEKAFVAQGIAIEP